MLLAVPTAPAQTGTLPPATHFSFTSGHIYTVGIFTRTILEHNATGTVVAGDTISENYADALHGLAFGPDGYLYVVAERNTGFAVLAVDATGTVRRAYPMNGVYVGGNLSDGKIAVDAHHIYVAGGDQITKFDIGSPTSGTSIYTNNQLFDVKILRNGNLLAASAYEVNEITTAGTKVRSIVLGGGEDFVDVRGVEYDPVTDKLFVTHLGYSDFYFRLMRINATTGALEKSVEFNYADDLFLLANGNLLVGSVYHPPRLYTPDLTEVRELGPYDAGFITQFHPPPRPVGGTFKVGPATITPDMAFTGTFANWKDSALPLTYEVLEGNTVLVPSSASAKSTFALPLGTHLLHGRITDRSGVSTETREVAVQVVVGPLDPHAPKVTVTAPTGKTIPATFDLAGTVAEDTALQSFLVMLNGVALVLDTPLSFAPSVPALWAISGIAAENGINFLEATATDFSGHTTHLSRTFTYVNDRPALAGIYQALLLPDDLAVNQTPASLVLTVTSTGAFTGKLLFSGTSFSLSGVLKNSGEARFKPDYGTTFALASRSLPGTTLGNLSLTIDVTGLDATLSIDAQGGPILARGSAEVSNFTPETALPAGLLNQPPNNPSKGGYNVVLPAKDQVPALDPLTYPQGHGYFSLTLTKRGLITIAGKLADGTPLAASSVYRPDHSTPIFAQLYQKAGYLCGELAFADLADSDLSGTDWHWKRAPVANSSVYPAGWTDVRLDPFGTQYAKPAALDFGQGAVNPGSGNTTLSFSGGLLPSTLQFAANVSPTTGAATRVPAKNPSFTLALKSTTGIFSGSVASGVHQRCAYSGVLLNKGIHRGGFGSFLSPAAFVTSAQSGDVVLAPAGP